jgi:UDP-N-acetylglucosamine pyrophosphorylase
MSSIDKFVAKMQSAGMGGTAINSFTNNFNRFLAGERAFIPESDVKGVGDIVKSEELPGVAKFGSSLFAVLKLNGGLGTTMGLTKAKSLLQIKGGVTFLDVIVDQVNEIGTPLILMNSYNTSKDTMEYLSKYPGLQMLEFVQSQIPKISELTNSPVTWSSNQSLEWCPPGHGDIYPSIYSSGVLDQLIGAGIEYLFISNSDNLGATLDHRIGAYFAENKFDFMMEVTCKTVKDIKGGGPVKLVDQNNKFELRELSQVLESDITKATDIEIHPFFNTNNLWINLNSLKTLLDKTKGIVNLPLIVNHKTVDPTDKTSEKVIQLETAMGSGLGLFDNSTVIEVPRSRFLPVKTYEDLEELQKTLKSSI